MFRKMRRKNQELPQEQVEEILSSCSTGILGVNGDDGYPYTVPLNYVYKEGSIFFHCALSGHKLDSVKKDDKVSFCVIGKDTVVSKAFATRYLSVIAFGRAKVLTEKQEQRRALMALVEKYSPDFMTEGKEEIESAKDSVCIVEIVIEKATGKKENSVNINQIEKFN